MKPLHCILMIMTLLCTALPSYSQDLTGDTSVYTPAGEEKAYRPFITAYAGIGWYYWNDYSSLFEMTNKNALKQKVDPYIMKKFFVKADLWLVNFGIEYLTSKFTNFEGITEERDIETKNDPIAKYLRLFSGISLFGVEIKGNVSFKKFQGTLESNGIKADNGAIIPVRFYPENGAYVDLDPGEEVSWYSIVKDYELLIAFGGTRRHRYGGYGSFDIGARYINFQAPQKLRFSEEGGMPLLSDITAVMITEYHIYNITFGMNTGYAWRSGIYTEFYFPAVLGMHRFENSYLKVDPKYPYNYTASGRGKLCLGYDLKHVRIEGGIDYSYFLCNTKASSRVKKQIDYLSEENGDPGTIPQGSKVEVSASRLELFWGFYVHAYILL